MAPYTQAYSFNVLATKKWEGIDPKSSPYGIEFECREGTLFDMIVRYFRFEQILQDDLTVKVPAADPYHKEELLRVEALKKQIAGGRVKVTIRLEVEKYAG